MTEIHHCAYCHGTVHVECIQLQGVGIFCSRVCARIFVSLRQSAFKPENIYTFQNPPRRFQVMAVHLSPDGVQHIKVGESENQSHAVQMASAYPTRAIVTDYSRRDFDNNKQILGAEVA